MSNWQTMDAAPKDGSPILLRLQETPHHSALNWENEREPRLVSIGRWHEDDLDRFKGWIILETSMEFSYGGDTHSFEYAQCHTVKPTGWMPIPGQSLATDAEDTADAVIEGELIFWDTDGGFLPPSIEVGDQDLAIWLAGQLSIPIIKRGYPKEGKWGKITLRLERSTATPAGAVADGEAVRRLA